MDLQLWTIRGPRRPSNVSETPFTVPEDPVLALCHLLEATPVPEVEKYLSKAVETGSGPELETHLRVVRPKRVETDGFAVMRGPGSSRDPREEVDGLRNPVSSSVAVL